MSLDRIILTNNTIPQFAVKHPINRFLLDGIGEVHFSLESVPYLGVNSMKTVWIFTVVFNVINVWWIWYHGRSEIQDVF